MVIRLGEHNTKSANDCENGTCAPAPQDLEVESIYLHPKYNTRSQENDIALLKLKKDAEFNGEYRSTFLIISLSYRLLNLKLVENDSLEMI